MWAILAPDVSPSSPQNAVDSEHHVPGSHWVLCHCLWSSHPWQWLWQPCNLMKTNWSSHFHLGPGGRKLSSNQTTCLVSLSLYLTHSHSLIYPHSLSHIPTHTHSLTHTRSAYTHHMGKHSIGPTPDWRLAASTSYSLHPALFPEPKRGQEGDTPDWSGSGYHYRDRTPVTTTRDTTETDWVVLAIRVWAPKESVHAN